VTWTQEREDFFTSMEKTFETIGDKLMSFDSDLSEKSINKMIGDRKFLLG
jgi:hypothetical protein